MPIDKAFIRFFMGVQNYTSSIETTKLRLTAAGLWAGKRPSGEREDDNCRRTGQKSAPARPAEAAAAGVRQNGRRRERVDPKGGMGGRGRGTRRSSADPTERDDGRRRCHFIVVVILKISSPVTNVTS